MGSNFKGLMEWLICIVIAVILALLFRFFIGTPTVVKQRSMFPTLKENQKLILSRTTRITGKDFEVGDIVTFEAPSRYYSEENAHLADQSKPIAVYENEPKSFMAKFSYYVLEFTKTSFIKRVIATEGQHVVIRDNHVYVNGNIIDESAYLGNDVVTDSAVFNDFIVPKGYYFCMGDNRLYSTDCRNFGCIPKEKIEGKIVYRFFPFDVMGSVK